MARGTTLDQIAKDYGHNLPIGKDLLPKGAIFGNVFNFDVTIADNAAAGSASSIDLTAGAVLGSDPLFEKHHGSANDPDVIIQVDALQLVMSGEEWATLTLAEKAKIQRGLEVRFTIAGDTTDYRIGQHVRDPYRYTAMATPAGNIAQIDDLGPFVLPAPVRLDLRRDAWSLEFSLGTPNGAAAIPAILNVWGFAVSNAMLDQASVRYGLNVASSQGKARYLGNQLAAAAAAGF